jgi:hypothetical protein
MKKIIAALLLTFALSVPTLAQAHGHGGHHGGPIRFHLGPRYVSYHSQHGIFLQAWPKQLDEFVFGLAIIPL